MNLTSILDSKVQSLYEVETVSTPGLVHSLVEAQARKHPDTIAVQFEEKSSITYCQLDELSTKLARRLVCGRGSIVPICMERSINMIISLLGVMKSGAAYVLVSPESSKERNQFIIDDTKAPFVLVDRLTFGNFGQNQVVIEDLMIDIRKTGLGLAGTPVNHLTYQSPKELAYVVYTSGTTGRPKGVLLSHQAASTGLAALPTLNGSAQSRSLLCHSPVFSAAQRTILGTLVRGGTLCLASKETLTTGLHELMQKLQIGSLEITPSMLQLLDTSQGLPASLTRITLGGEPAGSALIETWAERVELFSAYGLSEVTQLNMRSRIMPGQRYATLGRPTDSTSCHVLIPGTLSPAGVNMPGELCLAGDQLADGYLNLPKATAEVFVANPFGRGRLYRTGDMVKIHEDGSMQLLGRADFQIKVAGQRVEPGESNAIIQLQQGVADSCVIPATVLDRPEKSLVAVIILEDKTDTESWTMLVNNIRGVLRDQISAYSIPRYWTRINKMPLNGSGKTDMTRLVEMVETMLEDELVVAAPGRRDTAAGHLDPRVTELLAQTLGLRAHTITPLATFQELGGSSLDAIVLSSKLRNIGLRVEVRSLLQDISIAEVFANANAAASLAIPAAIPEPFSLLPQGALVDTNEFEDAYPATPLQEGILAGAVLDNVDYVYQRVYKIQGQTTEQVRVALQEIVRRSPILRTSFKPWKRSSLQLVNRSTHVPWTMMRGKDLQSALEEGHGRLLPPMSPGGPLIRAGILDAEYTYLVLEVHHGLFDFWSSQFIFSDMVSLLRGQQPSPRAPFSTYVAYQQGLAQDTSAQGYWEQFMKSVPDTVFVSSPEAATALDSKLDNFSIIGKLGDDLLGFSQSTGVTMATALHQAWAITLAQHLGHEDVVFMTACSGRDSDLDGILTLDGPTLNTVPFRVRFDKETLSPSTGVGTHAKKVQEDLWDVARYSHVGARGAMAAAALKPTAFNTMVNILVNMPIVDTDGPLVPVIYHEDNFTQ